jgi:antitoxin component YwqK of YwqJK toxin-antitoxin module
VLPGIDVLSLSFTQIAKHMEEMMSPRLKMLVKPISFTLIAGLLSACGAEEVDFRQLKTVQGLYYKVNDKEPFTGTVTNFPLYNSPINYGSCRTEVKSGLKDGVESCQYSDGKKYTEAHYAEGNKQGDEKRWHPDGFQYADLHWVNGKPDGLNKMWDEKKQPVSEIQVANGLKSGVERLWRDGVLEYDLVWTDGRQSGKYFYNGYYSVITNGARAPLLKVGTDEPYVEESEKRPVKNEIASQNPADCVAQKVKEVHEEAEESGEDMPISQDMLDEFKADCGSSE